MREREIGKYKERKREGKAWKRGDMRKRGKEEGE
jgi:hypothetical protein